MGDELDAAVARAVEAQRRWSYMRAEADEQRRVAVCAALDAGVGPTRLAREMGLSVSRIYQIRDDRR